MEGLLTSWKEIATYLGKGVRTVQRWEAVLGLPVHRLKEQRIMAVKKEIDSWLINQERARSDTKFSLSPSENSILAVDDNEIQCYSLSRLLKMYGYSVAGVFSGAE